MHVYDKEGKSERNRLCDIDTPTYTQHSLYLWVQHSRNGWMNSGIYSPSMFISAF